MAAGPLVPQEREKRWLSYFTSSSTHNILLKQLRKASAEHMAQVRACLLCHHTLQSL